MRSVSLYIHIPFCKRRCPYCTFYHEPSDEGLEERFVSSACSEIASAFEYLSDQNTKETNGELFWKTVYIGGGTPSVLKRSSIERLFCSIFENSRSPEEITFELNPEDVSASQLRFLNGLGINRVSLGIQSMDPAAQVTLSRCSKSINERSLRLVQNYFSNANVDILLGIPRSSFRATADTLDKILEYKPVHISVYCLEGEPKSKQVVRRFLSSIDEERTAKEYLYTCDRLEKHGYIHYEVSNFALPGFESKHNRAYWKGCEYIGIGPGAHSFVNGKRLYNTPSLQDYIGKSDLGFFERKRIDYPNDCSIRLEKLMLNLRTRDGISLDSTSLELEVVRKLIEDGLGNMEEGRFVLNNRGYLLLDEIVLRLVPEKEKN